MADEDFMRYLKRFFSEFMCLFIAVRASALCSFCSRLCAEFHDFIIKDWRNRAIGSGWCGAWCLARCCAWSMGARLWSRSFGVRLRVEARTVLTWTSCPGTLSYRVHVCVGNSVHFKFSTKLLSFEQVPLFCQVHFRVDRSKCHSCHLGMSSGRQHCLVKTLRSFWAFQNRHRHMWCKT